MIDFKNPKLVKLAPVTGSFDLDVAKNRCSPLLSVGESVILTFKGLRDIVIFTDRKIIAFNAQGVVGSKAACTAILYNKIQAFTVESAGPLDRDCELTIWLSGLGSVTFEFSKEVNINQIARLLTENI